MNVTHVGTAMVGEEVTIGPSDRRRSSETRLSSFDVRVEAVLV